MNPAGNAITNTLLAVITHEAVAIGLGGAAGANARYWLGKWIIGQPWSSSFPISTVLVNISGCFLLGLLGVLFVEKIPTAHRFWLLLLGTGFCGGYTTFSTFGYETFQLIEQDKWLLAIMNVTLSAVIGIAAVFFGVAIVRGTMSKTPPPNLPESMAADTAAGECCDK